MRFPKDKKSDSGLAKHYIIEFMDCDPQKISTVDAVQPFLLEAAKKSKATILEFKFHQFQPYGVSGVILIAESHFTIHTWPEHNYVAVDIFTCGSRMDPDIAVRILKQRMKAKKWKLHILERGGF